VRQREKGYGVSDWSPKYAGVSPSASGIEKPVDQTSLVARVKSMLRVKELHDKDAGQAADLASWNKALEQRVADQLGQIERVGRLKRFLAPQIAELILSERDERVLDAKMEAAPCRMLINEDADEVLGRPAFPFNKTPVELDLVVLSVLELGFGSRAIHRRAKQEAAWLNASPNVSLRFVKSAALTSEVLPQMLGTG
jgi:hypothetical protein